MSIKYGGNMRLLFMIGFLFFVVLMLVSCSYVSYQGMSDGSTKMSGLEIGSTTALRGANFSTDGKGVRSISIDSLDKDRVEGMRQINKGLSLLIEGAK